MDGFFIFLGKFIFCAIVILTIYCIYYFISIGVNELCWRYKYKHRFDKKPIAKCYCIDCKYHGKNNDNNLCQLHDRHFHNNWFCKDAKPKSAK